MGYTAFVAHPIRILFLADSHLGFDLPLRPRVRRRRRGDDFQANYDAALAPALRGEVDVVVHGGDVFHRSRVAPDLAWRALAPLARIAGAGVPVLVVPGNHERSRIPHLRFARHPRLHVFDGPRCFRLRIRGTTVAFAGFPFQRGDVRSSFVGLTRRTGWRAGEADVSVLCMHQCFEGATVGPGDYVFRHAPDVVRAADLPSGLTAILSGHIHRHQVLTRDLAGRPLAAPVLYPGSLERTSIAEEGERKGFLLLEIAADHAPPRLSWRFVPLAARPLVTRDVSVAGLDPAALDAGLHAIIASVPADAVLRLRTRGTPGPGCARLLSAAYLRSIAPGTMNIEARDPDLPRPRPREGPSPQVALDL